MRALGWPDAFVDSDLVVKKAMGETSAARVRARSEAWRPWRAYAVMHLWRNS
jgi:AraC family transcriptional regulator of adaptative response / DNA-3-methyladenine glycosylase II